ncbi:hypothetical protein [Curtobacterium sp. MCBD17_040]|uniref:hypothetical protein n=1 Tax=Curtobacterium sp. MCBD17_040 TaxID=2175674 RepID=UPI0011B5BE3D|nr:hypothetical protein [Curtobacterium sp. MCBD17_040]WIB65430.1 hypothetical protein DEI94_18665 [Curtobacterium sp. MCBD17_040]
MPLTHTELEGIFRDPNLPDRERFVTLAHTLAEQHPYEVGRTRIVFHTNTDVMKVPIAEEGLLDSWREANWSQRYGKTGEIPIATAVEEFIDDVPVLRMERVRMPTREEHHTLPRWTGSVDCAQVGWTAAGELVAFDL